jgi:hypothetical protein
MSVSQPALGFTASPSPVVLTSIVAPSGVMGLTSALRNDKSLRRFANAALGKDKRVMSVILSHFPTTWRDGDVDCKRFLFIVSSKWAKCSAWEYIVFPSKFSTAYFPPSLS